MNSDGERFEQLADPSEMSKELGQPSPRRQGADVITHMIGGRPVIRTTKIKTVVATAATAIAFASTALITATSASAWWPFDTQGPNIQKFGTREDLVDGAGTIVQGWTVHNLKPSTDVIPYPRPRRRNLQSHFQRPPRQRAQPIYPGSGAKDHWQAVFRRHRRRPRRSGVQQPGSRPTDLGEVRRRGRLP